MNAHTRFARFSAVAATITLVVTGCQAPGRGEAGRGAAAPLFNGMGDHHRAVTTQSRLAQRYFDQALTWAYAFNHDEAIRSFEAAGALDPDCAMAWWGAALCHGPHINNSLMTEAHQRGAWDSLQKALAARNKSSPIERELIDALAKRYANPAPADRAPLDRAYAEAMAAVWKAHPDDADVGTLYAESLMDLQPWDLWTQAGEPKGATPEIVSVLERVLSLNPLHPGANHLYIHTVEASPQPQRGIAAADRLRAMVPIAGHLVHMPAHIDVRVGQWAQASEANERAIKADERYRRISPQQDFYRVYMAHNHQFLAFASMMEGRRAVALSAARAMIAGVPEVYARQNAVMVDGYLPIALEAMMRFGLWDEILAEPQPPAYLPIYTAFWRFTRGVAQAAKGRVEDAQREQAEFRKIVAQIPQDALMAINPAHKVLSIADHVLAGEIALRRGQIDEAVSQLQAGVKVEDDLLYMEPPDWIQPLRHTLGAVLVSAGRFKDAEPVYREDLRRWPENGWSLYGLAECLKSRGADAEAAEVERRFKKAWSRADTQIKSTCLCVSRGD
ncbi:MAG: tetratricopeptide repeat protein [Phycisphaerae bacterium]